ncbi:alpha/beta fold hydrolase [Rufibacter glacialis]|uniref:Alpha/beta fold hydrolase n=1 Tax=Rufibacter glacialis TaxID=1259555 RepID=A0A5M8QA07_9BACT|nr:alpha/beta fold hydrolase [Rufibacter glacialis]KAA6431690.1 alpha/beta fold hydrolase [Rufibacter glacialis]GGK82394.1 hydrolase [Rufibacter glacialis]
MDMHFLRLGQGKPLLLLHGIGGSSRSWQLMVSGLVEAGREVIVVDLPGHGATPPLPGEVSIRTLADAVTDFLEQQQLLGIDAVGSSMGARLVLELARRGGVLGAVVALDPGGFWQGWEKPFFYYSVAASKRLVQQLQPIMPALAGSPIGRTLLLPQFSARPWKLPAELVLEEMRTLASSPSFDELLYHLAYGETQKGAPRGTISAPLVIGWGRQDRVCFPAQASRALSLFPDACLHWFARCGHFPQWDSPEEAIQLVLTVTSGINYEPLLSAEMARERKPGTSWAAILGLGLAVGVGGYLLSRRSAG